MKLAPFIACLLPVLAFAEDAPRISMEAVEARFSPHGGIDSAIVAEISASKSTILCEAYTLTSKPIIAALVAAQKRGVGVTILLDGAYGLKTGAALLAALRPCVLLDRAEGAHGGIAHAKVFIIDQTTVILGSYNFTGKANTANHEVCLFIRKASPKFIAAFVADFEKHKSHSSPQPTLEIDEHPEL